MVIIENGLVPLEGPCGTSGPFRGASDSLFKGEPSSEVSSDKGSEKDLSKIETD